MVDPETIAMVAAADLVPVGAGLVPVGAGLVPVGETVGETATARTTPTSPRVAAPRRRTDSHASLTCRRLPSHAGNFARH